MRKEKCISNRINVPFLNQYIFFYKFDSLFTFNNSWLRSILGKSTGFHKVKFQEILKKNEKYWVIEDYGLDLNVPEGSVNYQSFLEGNKVITDNINRVLNDNWEVGRDLTISQVEKIGGLVWKNYANSFFERVPFDEIFLK